MLCGRCIQFIALPPPLALHHDRQAVNHDIDEAADQQSDDCNDRNQERGIGL